MSLMWSLDKARGLHTFVLKLSKGLSPKEKKLSECLRKWPISLALPSLLPLLLPLLLEDRDLWRNWDASEVVARSSGWDLFSNQLLESTGEKPSLLRQWGSCAAVDQPSLLVGDSCGLAATQQRDPVLTLLCFVCLSVETTNPKCVLADVAEFSTACYISTCPSPVQDSWYMCTSCDCVQLCRSWLSFAEYEHFHPGRISNQLPFLTLFQKQQSCLHKSIYSTWELSSVVHCWNIRNIFSQVSRI
jgi:hypothetical protein